MHDQQIDPLLESRKTTNPALFHAEVFRQVLNGQTHIDGLSPQAAELGSLLLSDCSEGIGNPAARANIVYLSEAYNRIVELLGDQEWEEKENYALLVYLFGTEKAAYVRQAWKQVRWASYQRFHYRRSFRAPNTPEIYKIRQIEFFTAIICQSYVWRYNSSYEPSYSFYDLSVTEQIQYAHQLGDQNASLFRLWSAAIDLGNEAVLQQMESILNNEAEVGKVTTSILKALLNSEHQKAWELVGKILLAAQRQEGLRQSILEVLDETSIGALKYILNVVLENKLHRFSSVVRAVDVWAGLGWASERETAVRVFLEKAAWYLNNQEAIPAAVKSLDNADVYMALWAQGVYDIESTMPLLKELTENGDAEKRTVALHFAHQVGYYRIEMPMYYHCLQIPGLQPLALAITGVVHLVGQPGYAPFYSNWFPDLFATLHRLYEQETVKEQVFEGYAFSWLKISFDKKNILKAMLCLVDNDAGRLDTVLGYFEGMDASLKRELSSLILPKHSHYNYKVSEGQDEPLTPFQRRYAFLILPDRSEFQTAFNALYNIAFDQTEVDQFADLLKRKAAGFRNSAIQLLLRQQEQLLSPLLEKLLAGADVEQRLAGLDILLQLRKQSQLPPQAANWLSAMRERRKISPKEEILLSQLDTVEAYGAESPENGFGLYDPFGLVPVVEPSIDPESLYEKAYAQHPFGFSMPLDKIQAALNGLAGIVHEHRDHEYEIERWEGARDKVLLGNRFGPSYAVSYEATAQEKFAAYPLPHLWEAWYLQWQLKPVDLFLIHVSVRGSHGTPEKMRSVIKLQFPEAEDLFSGGNVKLRPHWHGLLEIIRALFVLFPFEQQNEFSLGAAVRLYASLDDSIRQYRDDNQYVRHDGRGWQRIYALKYFLDLVDVASLEGELLKLCWNLYHWRQYAGLAEEANEHIGPLLIFCKAFDAGHIGEDDMYRGILTQESIRQLSRKITHSRHIDYHKHFPFLTPMFDRVRDRLLDIELKRGDSDTPATGLIMGIQTLYGVNRLSQLLAGLGKTNLYKGYIYSWSINGNNKQQSFSYLLKACLPLPGDTQELFGEAMRGIKATEERLIETAMYAPQWQNLISQYLGWKGLDTAIWWMHAHTKSDGYQVNEESESVIARYSSIGLAAFKEGAVDKDWFHHAYKEIGKQRWPIVYEAAKYISDGNGHRRARIYADALLGVLKLKEVAGKVSDKRDQDYLRIYGLVPLSRAKPAQDVLERYQFLMKFKKGSSEFGSQKQASEAAAFRIAMDNLARNAGYADPVRLTWAMETKEVQAILSKQTSVIYDDTELVLEIDASGEADVVAYKANKALKAIPAAYKKDKKVLELMGFRKVLREQRTRSRKSLEEAMVRGDQFELPEVANLYQHPVIASHLRKLVWVADQEGAGSGALGFYEDGVLQAPDGTSFKLKDGQQLRIAHCTDLYKAGIWGLYQRWAFEHNLAQPFKQLFRELYLPTADELTERTISRRYAGHQVQPRQTVALLKSRNWKVDPEEGLQKVFHLNGFAARLYAMADWLSPAEVESPTLETIQFHDLRSSKQVPFAEIPSLVFSEVMRDVDLVVSIAHVGGVDPEASHSTIDMRAVLLRETIRLYKLSNVEIVGSHAKIKGTMGEYSVHLGSAVTHKMAQGYLSIIPVHSQHRGRLFLPFVDDDPRSAEVISKVLLLARDQDIQDPQLLQQIQGV